MKPENFAVRKADPGDTDAILSVVRSAFPSDEEANIVKSLKDNKKLQISLVATLNNEVVGYIAFSSVDLIGSDEQYVGLGLAPVAVIPQHQSKGVGSKLIKESLQLCLDMRTPFIVVLGEPSFYCRFNFVKASDFKINNEYGADNAFMVLELQPNTLPKDGGIIRYTSEFRAGLD